jgi:hypothetical protein
MFYSVHHLFLRHISPVRVAQRTQSLTQLFIPCLELLVSSRTISSRSIASLPGACSAAKSLRANTGTIGRKHKNRHQKGSRPRPRSRRMGNENSTIISDDEPTKTLERRDLASVAKLIKEGRAKRIVVMTGAGISTAAGSRLPITCFSCCHMPLSSSPNCTLTDRCNFVL